MTDHNFCSWLAVSGNHGEAQQRSLSSLHSADVTVGMETYETVRNEAVRGVFFPSFPPQKRHFEFKTTSFAAKKRNLDV